MTLRALLWFVATLILAFTNALAHGERAGKPGDTGETSDIRAAMSNTADNLTVTIELPQSSPYLQVLSPMEIGAVTKNGTVRLQASLTSGRLASLPVAEVNEESITLGDLRRAMSQATEEEAGGATQANLGNPMEILERLVEIRLFVQEAKEIGLDELPGVRNLVDVFFRRTLRENLLQRQIKEVKVDEREAQRLYEEAVREWRVKGLIFKEEADATTFLQAVKDGASFDEAARKYVADGKATSKGGELGEYVKRKDLLPEMGTMIGELTPGSITRVMAVEGGVGVIQLLEARLPESEKARAGARQQALNFAQNVFLVEYRRQLVEKYVKIHKDQLDELDFGGTVENFENLLKDERAVASIQGEDPVKVSDLARAMREKFYHGIGRAIEAGKSKDMKLPALNEILSKRVFLKEALAQGIDKTSEFIAAVAEYENSVLFGTFIERVMRPEIKVTPTDIREYYENHIDQFSSPEMVVLKSIAFRNDSDAQEVLEKLRKGTDYRWVKGNAGGQVELENNGGSPFTGSLQAVGSLPEAVRRVLVGVDEGDYLIYKDKGKYFHVVHVEKRVPAEIKSLEQSQKKLIEDVYKENFDQALRGWKNKLKQAYSTHVYVKEFTESAK